MNTVSLWELGGDRMHTQSTEGLCEGVVIVGGEGGSFNSPEGPLTGKSSLVLWHHVL